VHRIDARSPVRAQAAIRRVFAASWQRCRVHWMRNALSYVPKTQQSMVAAALRQAFIQPDRTQASQTLRHVADQLRLKWPKLASFIDDSETDVLSHLDFPEQHRTKLQSTDEIDKPQLQTKPSFSVRPRGAVFLSGQRGELANLTAFVAVAD
jgi:putative transposase